MDLTEYRTVAGENRDEFTEKKSRFIGHAAPASSEEEARNFIDKIKSEYWNASTNAFAYIIREGNIQRYSDAGEPQGTAGVPSLEVLKKEGLVNVAVVITRYFGGIHLGAGGLLRAFSHATKIAVDAATVITMKLFELLEIECQYSDYGKLQSEVLNFGGIIESTAFTDQVQMCFFISVEVTESFKKKITEVSSGKIVPFCKGCTWRTCN